MQFSFLPAAIFLAVIGVQSHPRREIVTSLLHGFIITLIFAAFSSVFLPVISGGGLRDCAFLMNIVLHLYWIFFIYAALAGIALFFVRKLKSKKHLRLGYGIVIVVLGAGFYIGHYLITRAIAEAIYIGIMMSR